MGRRKPELADLMTLDFDAWQLDEIVIDHDQREELVDRTLEPVAPNRESRRKKQREEPKVVPYQERPLDEQFFIPLKTDWTALPMDYQARTMTMYLDKPRMTYQPTAATNMYGYAETFTAYLDVVAAHDEGDKHIDEGFRVKHIRVSGGVPQVDGRERGWLHVPENWFPTWSETKNFFIMICEDYRNEVMNAAITSLYPKHRTTNLWEDNMVGQMIASELGIELPAQRTSRERFADEGFDIITITVKE